ncbi:MAG: methyltransferase domain-containing protein [Methylocella sp.]
MLPAVISIPYRIAICGIALAAMLGAHNGAAGQTVAPDYAAIVAAPERSDADRQTDQPRDPAKLLAFAGVRPGMKVLDVGAGAGYSTELLARAVGDGGVVYAQDSTQVIERYVKDRFDLRAKALAMEHVVHLVRDYDDPLPQDVRDLDLVTIFFFYHAISLQPVDRAKMNQRLFDALKPGGYLVIADHSARLGDGTAVASTLLRIEENVVRREVEAAGFKLVAEGDFLRHPDDPRDALVAGSKTPVDEFVLKFEKPLR